MNLYKYLIITFLFSPFSILAQDNFTFKKGHELTVLGRTSADKTNYHRIDSVDVKLLPDLVRRFSKYSAGMNIAFKTNSKSIKLNWKLDKLNAMWNMSSVGVNGLDLYCWNGKMWQYVSSARPTGTDNSVLLVDNLDGQLRNYRIFLPIYSEVKDIEVGVFKDAQIFPGDAANLPTRKVAIYGSSITQGIAASRPGMTYPSILSRKMKIDFLNLGFSGSGKMEIEIADILAKIPAEVYVLDCVPNALPHEVKERSYPLVSRLRKLKPEVPIVMVESVRREISNWNSVMKDRIEQQNGEFKKTYDKLLAEGNKNIYYIKSEDLMGDDHDATVDGTHLTDLGYMRISETIGKQLAEIMNIKFIK
jgi:hypothetical protein